MEGGGRRRRDGATGISAFPLGWPREAQSSPRVARESWGWRSSTCSDTGHAGSAVAVGREAGHPAPQAPSPSPGWAAGRLLGTVSPFRAEQGTSLETPSRARASSCQAVGTTWLPASLGTGFCRGPWWWMLDSSAGSDPHVEGRCSVLERREAPATCSFFSLEQCCRPPAVHLGGQTALAAGAGATGHGSLALLCGRD